MKTVVAVGTMLLLASLPVQAEWVLDKELSRVNFVTTKANTAAEVHTFKDLDGRMTEDGKALIRINLDSVDTAIEIRDERMRGMLFETQFYPEAILAAKVDTDSLDVRPVGDTMLSSAEAELQLHSAKLPMIVEFSVSRLSPTRLAVSSFKPIVVNAGQVNLAEGVERLREIAGLPSISPAVPVSFSLVFNLE